MTKTAAWKKVGQEFI